VREGEGCWCQFCLRFCWRSSAKDWGLSHPNPRQGCAEHSPCEARGWAWSAQHAVIRHPSLASLASTRVRRPCGRQPTAAPKCQGLLETSHTLAHITAPQAAPHTTAQCHHKYASEYCIGGMLAAELLEYVRGGRGLVKRGHTW